MSIKGRKVRAALPRGSCGGTASVCVRVLGTSSSPYRPSSDKWGLTHSSHRCILCGEMSCLKKAPLSPWHGTGRVPLAVGEMLPAVLARPRWAKQGKGCCVTPHEVGTQAGPALTQHLSDGEGHLRRHGQHKVPALPHRLHPQSAWCPALQSAPPRAGPCTPACRVWESSLPW